MGDAQIAVIVLAAGGSRRMGEAKQLLEIEGKSLLRRTVETALAAEADWVLVTLGNRGQECHAALGGLNCNFVPVPDWSGGLSRSIRRGLKQVQTHNEALAEADIGTPFYAASLFVPCDLPQLSTSHLNALIATYRATSAPIVASRFSDVVGVPALFDVVLWPEFDALVGDEGARKIIRQAPERVKVVEFEAGAIDLDTPQDYAAFLAHDLDHFQSD